MVVDARIYLTDRYMLEGIDMALSLSLSVCLSFSMTAQNLIDNAYQTILFKVSIAVLIFRCKSSYSLSALFMLGDYSGSDSGLTCDDWPAPLLSPSLPFRPPLLVVLVGSYYCSILWVVRETSKELSYQRLSGLACLLPLRPARNLHPTTNHTAIIRWASTYIQYRHTVYTYLLFWVYKAPTLKAPTYKAWNECLHIRLQE